MANPQARFNEEYVAAVSRLAQVNPEDDALSSLAFAEELRKNSGSDEYAPGWLRPFVAIAAQLVAAGGEQEMSKLAAALAPVIARATQLGYAEGYFAAKED